MFTKIAKSPYIDVQMAVFRGMFWYSHKKIWSGTSMYVNLFGAFWVILATKQKIPRPKPRDLIDRDNVNF